MKHRILAAAASLAALVSVQPAQADVTKAVYAGVFNIYDETGYMGQGTGSYQKYGTMTFLFDSDTYRATYSESVRAGVSGGTSTLSGSGEYSPGKGYFNIGSFSSGFIGSLGSNYGNSSFFYKTDGVGNPFIGVDQINQQAYQSNYDVEGYYAYKDMAAYAYSDNDAFVSSIDPDAAESYTLDYLNGYDYSSATFHINQSNPGSYAYAYGSFNPTSVTITNLSGATLRSLGISSLAVAAVPEPSTWAMMLLGFGGMGAVLRRRRALPGGALVPVRA